MKAEMGDSLLVLKRKNLKRKSRPYYRGYTFNIDTKKLQIYLTDNPIYAKQYLVSGGFSLGLLIDRGELKENYKNVKFVECNFKVESDKFINNQQRKKNKKNRNLRK